MDVQERVKSVYNLKTRITSERLPTMQILVSIGTVRASPQIGEILPLLLYINRSAPTPSTSLNNAVCLYQSKCVDHETMKLVEKAANICYILKVALWKFESTASVL